MQEEKENLKKDPRIGQYRDEILGLGQDKDQMLRLQHYRDRMLGLVKDEPPSKQEKLNMWSIKEGNENILRLDEYMNELTKLQETREEMLKMQKDGLMRLQQDREEMLKMQQNGLLKLQRDREEIMYLQEVLLSALQQGTSNDEKLQQTMKKMMQLQEDTEQIFREQQNNMLTFQKDCDDLDRSQEDGLFNIKENKFFQLMKKKNEVNNQMNKPDIELLQEEKFFQDSIQADHKEQREERSNESSLVHSNETVNFSNSVSETMNKTTSYLKKKPVVYSKHYAKTVNINKRNFGLDVVRSLAGFLVLSINFFLYNGYYVLPQAGVKVWVVDWARCFVFVGVPMFLMITGYLRGSKKPTKNYYLGIIPILLTWVIATVICVIFKIYYLNIEKKAILWIADIFNFVGATYSWYIEMYIGVFLLCPFINKVTERMEKKQFQILLGTMMVLTFLPTLTNRWGGNELNLNLLPDYWMSLYPFTYYLIGSYIKKFNVKLPFIKGIMFALLFAMIKGSIIYYTAKGGIFVERIGDGYSDIFVAGTAICLFLAFYDLKTKNQDLKRVFYHISNVSLALYLISWIFDRMLYTLMLPYFSVDNYLWCYLIFVPTSFFCSLLTATVIDRVVQWTYQKCLDSIIYLKNRKNSPEEITYKRG